MDEDSLINEFNLATTIHKRIVLQRHTRELGFVYLADKMLKNLLGEHQLTLNKDKDTQ